MKILDQSGREIQACVQLEYYGFRISMTTIPMHAELKIFRVLNREDVTKKLTNFETLDATVSGLSLAISSIDAVRD